MKLRILKILMVVLFLGVGFLMIPPALADEDDPPGRVARLSYMDGAVSLAPAGTNEWLDADPNRPITRGDQLWADADSRAELQIGSAAIRCADHTGFSFLDLADEVVQIQLVEGAISIQLQDLDEGEVFEVDTPNLAFNLQRPGDYRIEVSPEGDTTVVVRRGLGEVTGGGRIYAVRSNQRASFVGADEFESYIDQVGDYDDFDQWCHDRDLRQRNSISSRYVPRGVIGYEDLDEYGDWRTVSEYGAVWFPRRVAVGWTPYRYGHWVWIAPWGWTWIDDAPWGFAPSHYGRWAYVRGAWGWCPGPRMSAGVVVRPVYAPALVAWVGSPSLSVGLSVGGASIGVGWFPLAPREVYVPPYRVSRSYVTNVNITNTVVNNVTVLNAYENPRTSSVRYVNRTRLTAVPRTVFVSAEPVARNIVQIDATQAARAQITTNIGVVPQDQSVAPPARHARARPPIELRERTVVAKTPPPPAPVSFARQRDAIAANGGRPLARREAERLEPQRQQPPTPVKVEKPATSPVPVESVAKPEAEAPKQPAPRTRGRGRFGPPPARGAAPGSEARPGGAREPIKPESADAPTAGTENPNALEAKPPEPSERSRRPERPGYPPAPHEQGPENSADRNPSEPSSSLEKSPREQRLEQMHQQEEKRLLQRQELERRQTEQRHQEQVQQGRQPDDRNQQLERQRLQQKQAQQRLDLRKRQQQERERLQQEERKKKSRGPDKKEPSKQ